MEVFPPLPSPLLNTSFWRSIVALLVVWAPAGTAGARLSAHADLFGVITRRSFWRDTRLPADTGAQSRAPGLNRAPVSAGRSSGGGHADIPVNESCICSKLSD